MYALSEAEQPHVSEEGKTNGGERRKYSKVNERAKRFESHNEALCIVEHDETKKKKRERGERKKIAIVFQCEF